ncbi:MAG: NUMOD4 domain-containing protein [Thiomicrorhabdus sp.]|jgi:hypothetical protein|nr:NUMOD4 domain-containing protein [Thiomicrorhabdus sp.]
MEVWRDIPGFVRLYQISNKGRLKSLSRLDARGHTLHGRIIKLGSTKGYLNAKLCRKGKAKSF